MIEILTEFSFERESTAQEKSPAWTVVQARLAGLLWATEGKRVTRPQSMMQRGAEKTLEFQRQSPGDMEVER